jgi:flagellar protein FliS
MYQQAALSNYRSIQLETATPHELVERLYVAAIRSCRAAAKSLDAGDESQAREAIHRAQDILTELMAALDFNAGGEIASHLHQLYRYMYSRLVRAQVGSDAVAAKEVAELLSPIAEAWAEIRTGHKPEE